MTTDILHTIVAHKRTEIALQEEAVSQDFLIQQLALPSVKKPEAGTGRIALGHHCGIQTTLPSKGDIAPQADPTVIVPGYERAGASGISVLTAKSNFAWGNLKDLQAARPLTHLPVLRKDFIVSPYQLYQAKLAGADVVLLIAAALTVDECKALGKLAHQLEMEVLLEIHTEKELDYLHEHVDLIGVTTGT